MSSVIRQKVESQNGRFKKTKHIKFSEKTNKREIISKRVFQENKTRNKAKGLISKRVFQENKTRQIFRKNEHF